MSHILLDHKKYKNRTDYKIFQEMVLAKVICLLIVLKKSLGKLLHFSIVFYLLVASILMTLPIFRKMLFNYNFPAFSYFDDKKYKNRTDYKIKRGMVLDEVVCFLIVLEKLLGKLLHFNIVF